MGANDPSTTSTPPAVPPLKVEALSNMPWDPDVYTGDTRVSGVGTRAAVQFPVGTTYAEGVRELYASYRGSGTLPVGAAVVPSLPTGKVLLPANTEHGVTISLVAPFGWDIGSGRVRSVTFGWPAGVTPAEANLAAIAAYDSGVAVPKGATVDVPTLDACQIVDPKDPAASADCSKGDQ